MTAFKSFLSSLIVDDEPIYHGNRVKVCGGPIADFYTDVVAGGIETDLYVNNVIAGLIDADGEKLRAEYSLIGTVNPMFPGTFYQPRLYFAGQNIFDPGPLAGGVGPLVLVAMIKIDMLLIRQSATEARAIVVYEDNSGVVTTMETDLVGLDWTVGNLLQLTGQVGAISSLTAKLGAVFFHPVAS